MTDYISRIAGKEKCCSLCRWEGTDNCEECEHPIDDIPAADVREVVLCRDCRWWRGEGTICKGIAIDFDADGFCCEGERKDGAEMRPPEEGKDD